MGTRRWWEQRRFGLLVQTNLATVPAWAPLGQDAEGQTVVSWQFKPLPS